MKNNRDSRHIFIIVLLLLLLALALMGSSISLEGVLRKVFMVSLIIVAILFIAALIITICIILAERKKYREEHSGEENDKKCNIPAGNDEKEKIKSARRNILEIRKMTGDVEDKEVRDSAAEALEQAEKIVDTLSKQPEEIKKNREFFIYYLPTFETILTKYTMLEKGKVTSDTAKDKTLRSCMNLKETFEKIYENLFLDEILDLAVEEKTLKHIMESDGYRD